MNPFFFGSSDRPLFGVYTHAKSTVGSPTSVLLCYPLGSEYMRAHRAFRQINNLMNRAGLNVLRFDYSCTGDSSGEGAEASVEAWLDDIDWAIEELKDNAMSDRVFVVGLRWGATLASIACSERTDVEELLMWDPVVSGSDYLDDHVGSPRPREVVGLDGFPLTPSLVAEMEPIDLCATLGAAEGPNTTVLVAEDRPDYREVAQALARRKRGEHFEVVPSSGNWAQADPFGDALIPQRIMQAIVDRLSGVADR